VRQLECQKMHHFAKIAAGVRQLGGTMPSEGNGSFYYKMNIKTRGSAFCAFFIFFVCLLFL